MNSLASPYAVVDIAHFNNGTSPIGKLSVSIAPGKKDQRWNRDLSMDLQAMKSSGVRVIVCLLQWSEMKMLQIPDYPHQAQEQGFIFLHLPVKDRRAPALEDISVLIPSIVQYLARGYSVLVHCRSGLGRAGTIAACCLLHYGYKFEQSVALVRSLRPGAIQTQRQVKAIEEYGTKF